jgi:hypothetical protein
MRLTIIIAASAATAALSIAAPAGAQERERLLSLWMVEPAPPPEGVRHLGSKEYVLKQRLLPTGLAEIGRSTLSGEIDAALTEGTQLIEVKGASTPVYCEGELKGRKQQCFVDADGNGSFESWFKAMSTTPAFVTISGKMPKTLQPLANPIPYKVLDPAQSKLDAFVAIERRNWFNIYSRESFMIVFGSEDKKERISQPIQFKSAEMPKELTVLGARFTALSEADGKMAIKVHSSMPAQPFGVIQTVSYR